MMRRYLIFWIGMLINFDCLIIVAFSEQHYDNGAIIKIVESGFHNPRIKITCDYLSKMEINLANSRTNLKNSIDVMIEQLLWIKKQRLSYGCDVQQIAFHKSINSTLHQRQVKYGYSTRCVSDWLGDGYCDLGCNTIEHNYDDGDCCRSTCYSRNRFYPCGYTSFQCLQNRKSKIPNWFFKQIIFCHKWQAYPTTSEKQCGGQFEGERCSPIGSMTTYYRDNTGVGKELGGCLSTWKIAIKGNVPFWFARDVQLCFRHRAERNSYQCNGGTTPDETCVNIGDWLRFYLDQSDSRPGGCLISWMLKIRQAYYKPLWLQNIRLCMMYNNDNNDSQCGGTSNKNRYYCASINQWTEYYNDNTDDRPGGCQMSWGILI